MQVFGQGDGKSGRWVAGVARKRVEQLAHLRAAAGEHHLNGTSSRSRQGRPRAAAARRGTRRLASKNGRCRGWSHSMPLEHHLPRERPVEDERRRVAAAAASRRSRAVPFPAAAGTASRLSPSSLLTTAPLLRIRVSGRGSASKIGRANSNRRPVASATSTPAAMARAWPHGWQAATGPHCRGCVPSMSREIRRIMQRGTAGRARGRQSFAIVPTTPDRGACRRVSAYTGCG